MCCCQWESSFCRGGIFKCKDKICLTCSKYTTEHEFKSNITKKYNIITYSKKKLHSIHNMWFIYFLAIIVMYNMYVKLLYHFIKQSIYTNGPNLDVNMLSNISKTFALVNLSQFKSLRYFLVLDTRTKRCVQLNMKLG